MNLAKIRVQRGVSGSFTLSKSQPRSSPPLLSAHFDPSCLPACLSAMRWQHYCQQELSTQYRDALSPPIPQFVSGFFFDQTAEHTKNLAPSSQTFARPLFDEISSACTQLQLQTSTIAFPLPHIPTPRSTRHPSRFSQPRATIPCQDIPDTVHKERFQRLTCAKNAIFGLMRTSSARLSRGGSTETHVQPVRSQRTFLDACSDGLYMCVEAP